jgi:hypothetical protein
VAEEVEPDPEWPYRCTRERYAAAETHFKEVATLFPRTSKEYRVAAMSFYRLRRRKGKAHRFPSKTRADREHRLRMIADRGKQKVAEAEKAIEGLYDLASRGRSALLMRRFVQLAEQYGPAIMEERLKDAAPATRYRALGELFDLLKCAYKTDEEKAPKKAAGPRRVVVSWPNEGAKS